MGRGRKGVLGAALVMLAFAANAREANGWTLVDLGTLGGPGSYGAAVSDSGLVVGCADVDSAHAHAFLDHAGAMRDLGPGCALAVNDAGLAAGRGATGELVTWQDSTVTPLGVKGTVGAVNDAGIVVGSSTQGAGTRAFKYFNGRLTVLAGETAAAINSRGIIAGTANGHAVLYLGDTIRDLGTLGGGRSDARGLNDRGDLVGMSTDANGQPISFLFDGAMSALPAPGYSYAVAINERGQVVGSAEGAYGYLLDGGAYTRIDTLPDVAAKGWRHLEPTGINAQGWIVGTGTNADGDLRAFLLVPATERVAMRTAASPCGVSSVCRSASMPR